MQPMNKYGGVQAARFGNAGQPFDQQQQMMMAMQMEMDSYGEEDYGEYDDETDAVAASGDTEGAALYQVGNQ